MRRYVDTARQQATDIAHETLDFQKTAAKVTVDKQEIQDLFKPETPSNSSAPPAPDEHNPQIYIRPRVSERIHLATRNEDELNSLMNRLDEPREYTRFVDTFYDLPDRRLTSEGIWISRRNEAFSLRFSLSDPSKSKRITDIVLEGRWHVEQFLTSIGFSFGDLEVLFNLPTQRLEYSNGIVLECSKLLAINKHVVILQLRGRVDLQLLEGLDFTRSGSKVAEAFLANDIDAYDFHCLPGHHYPDAPSAFTTVAKSMSRKHSASLLKETSFEVVDQSILDQESELCLEFERVHLDNLSVRSPYLVAIFTSHRKTILIDSEKNLKLVLEVLKISRPYIVYDLIPRSMVPKAFLVNSSAAFGHSWKLPVILAHPALGKIADLDAVVDTGCETGLGCIPFANGAMANPNQDVSKLQTGRKLVFGVIGQLLL